MASQGSYSDVILAHYRREAETHGTDATSTMKDGVTRGREIEGVKDVMRVLRERGGTQRVVDIGCGNGYLLEVLRHEFHDLDLVGIEYTPEMVELARSRHVTACDIERGNVCELPFRDASFDAVISERCIINVMDRGDQERAFAEVARILRPGGNAVCIEAFTDGLAELNAARAELGLPPNVVPHHNLWFEKDWFLRIVGERFEIVSDAAFPPTNFLSSHYFISRVLYPSITKREIIYNAHLVRFFAFLPPMGNYSPIQFHVLRKRA
jgi:ubiquinone/menaquinone biosynthesis C-methylase UbiE